jgi:hypothetical protein
LITTSFSEGFAVGPGPTLRGFALAAGIHAAWFFNFDAILSFEINLDSEIVSLQEVVFEK